MNILIGGFLTPNRQTTEHCFMLPQMANRHGLIAGATGTGKTVTLQVLAEQFSKLGVPVFTADVKGDLSGLTHKGKDHPKITERVEALKLSDFEFYQNPAVFWDLEGDKGHPVRTTISELGPLLLSRLLDLNDTQQGVIELAFSVADDEGLLLLDTKDLRSLLNWISDNSKDFEDNYGRVSSQSVGAILRRLLALEEAGGERFFGEPALKLQNLMSKDFSGNGVINILDARDLVHDSRIYSTFLLWLMSELFEVLPEVGDIEKPKMVFFFDEAHLLFKDMPKVLLEKVETVVRLIRSKGVGIYFVTQNPTDIPDSVLSQLGNRIQHGLRAYTPKEQKVIKSVSQTFRQNPNLDPEQEIGSLGIGEALVSTLDEDGIASPVEKVLVKPPSSQIGPITDQYRAELISRSPYAGIYDEIIDNESAYEILAKRKEEELKRQEEEGEVKKKSGYKRQGFIEAFFKTLTRTIGSQIGRSIVRGVLGSIKR